MTKELKLTIRDEPVEVETLEVDLNTVQVKASLKAYFFDDHQFTIFYIPSLNLTAYGYDEEQAREMMERAMLPDLCEIWLNVSRSDIYAEFEELGWATKSEPALRFEKADPFPVSSEWKHEGTKKSSAVQVELFYA